MQVKEKSYRYERKFQIEELGQHQAIALIKRHPSMFYEPYPPRYVNNFYLDTKDFRHYHDNVVGAMNRSKVRIRWYADLFGKIEKPVLEFKVKEGLVGRKISFPFKAFKLGNQFNVGFFNELIQNADLSEEVNALLKDLDVVLLNRYFRRYYATRDNRYRVTLDSDLIFYKVNRLRNDFLHKQVDYRHVVAELKYASEYDTGAQRVSSFFPFSVTKSSKYVQGIEKVYL